MCSASAGLDERLDVGHVVRGDEARTGVDRQAATDSVGVDGIEVQENHGEVALQELLLVDREVGGAGLDVGQDVGRQVDRTDEHVAAQLFRGEHGEVSTDRARRKDGVDVMPHDELIARVSGKQALVSMITDAIDASVVQAGTELKIIANAAVGFNNIDVAAARERGIIVTNTPGVLTDATAVD